MRKALARWLQFLFSLVVRIASGVRKLGATVIGFPWRWGSRIWEWLRTPRRWRWALAAGVVLLLAFGAWSVLDPWVWLSGGPGERPGSWGTTWFAADRGRQAEPGRALDDLGAVDSPTSAEVGESEEAVRPTSDLTPIDPSRIPVPPTPVPQDPPAPSPHDTTESILEGHVSGDPAPAIESAKRDGDGREDGRGQGGEVGGLEREEAIPVVTTSSALAQAEMRDAIGMPASGPIVRETGWYRHPTYGDWRFYPGVEIQLRPGTPVRPALSGTVIDVFEDAQWGLTVRLEHGSGWETSYSYLREARVGPGFELSENDVLGVSGVTLHGEPHLLFAVWKDGDPVDPARLLP